jgi:hypothetical protein
MALRPAHSRRKILATAALFLVALLVLSVVGAG